MQTFEPPVLKHRDWRFLLRDITKAHPALLPVTSNLLRLGLAPAASMAWWLVKKHPELLDRPSLCLLVPGATDVESLDGGRWFSFLPWLVGRPALQVSVVLVGNEVVGKEHDFASSALSQLDGLNASPAKNFISRLPESIVFNGTLGQWRKGPGRDVAVDACVLFSPGLSAHYRTWLTEEGLLPLMRHGIPLGVFGYSKLDALEDQELFRLAGCQFSPSPLEQNPWHLQHEMRDFIGGFAQFVWTMDNLTVPASLDLENPEFKEFLSLQSYAHQDFEEFGADQALERMGASWPVVNRNVENEQDSIIVLPHRHGILESSGAVGYFDDDGFSPFEPPLMVPAESLSARPSDEDILARITWALRLHRDFVGPQVLARENESSGASSSMFDGLTPEDLQDGLRSLLASVGAGTVDPDAFMREVRIQGSIHGPTHPAWWDLLQALGWAPYGYVDEPRRLEPAFHVPAPRKATRLPVVCEAYAYFPDDEGDDLAQEAMTKVAIAHPDGALLLFKSVPYLEVGGHNYNFGGMLFWKNRWSPFAITTNMHSVDDVLEQIESGFSFGAARPEYADDRNSVAVPFNRMCYGLDPNEPTRVAGLTQGNWVTLIPG